MLMRVLMVEESLPVRDVMRHHLECIGCEVVAEAGDTTQALDLFRTVAPALVTLDIAVSRRGGMGALALFRAMRTVNPQTPILIVSGPAFPEVRRTFLSEGALDYILKPLVDGSFEQLFARLSAIFPQLLETAPERVAKAPLVDSSAARPMRARRRVRAA